MPQVGPQPLATFPWVDIKDGKPTSSLAQYMVALDIVVSSFFGRTTGLINAANDGAAAAAGVQVNQLYRNGSVVMIRVT